MIFFNYLQKKLGLAIFLILFISSISDPLHSQNTLDVFSLNESLRISINLDEDLEEFSILRIDNAKATHETFRSQNTTFKLKLPIDASTTIEIELLAHDFYAENFSVIEKTATGDKVVNFEKPLHYLGNVVGEPSSTVGFTLTKDQLYGVVAFNGNNYNIELNTRNDDGDYYLLYKQEDYKRPLNFQCDTRETPFIPSLNGLRSPDNVGSSRSVSTVDIYIECDYQMFLTNGTTTATITYATNLFNMVAGIYGASTNPSSGPRGANTILNLSQLVVWSTPDPYDAANLNNAGELLDLFVCQHSTSDYNGRLAHILTTASVGGGIAQRNDCPSTTGTHTSPLYGASGIHNTFNPNLSIYSWDINVLAHELGHQFSSPHTHDCAWNGNDTPIDCCGNNAGYGSCDCNAGVPSPAGTIMSYCHITYTNNLPNGNPGMDLSQGFHPQVAAKIEAFAGCLGPIQSSSCPTPTVAQISLSNITNNSVTVTCTAPGDFYAYAHIDRELGQFFCEDCVSVNNTVTITGLSPCRSYSIIIAAYCSSISEWSNYSNSSSACDPNTTFTTTGTNCPSSNDLGDGQCRSSMIVTDGDVPGSTGIFRSATTIETDGNVVEVNSGETVSYLAGNSVTLQPGFHAKGGSTFTVAIENCTVAVQEEETYTNALLETNEEIISNKLSKSLQLTQVSNINLAIQPNPFTNVTTLHFDLAEKEEISLLVFNLNGQMVDQIIQNQLMDKGSHTFDYNSQKLEEGMFHLVLKTNKSFHTKKMIILK